MVLRLRNRGTTDFGEIPVAKRNGRIYHLRDFASARWQEQRPTSYFRINGLNTITLAISCEAHTNMLRVAAAVKEEMARLQERFPPELSATLTYDATEYVSGELEKIYLRTLLCVAILLAFVFAVSRDLRYLAIIATTLAVNILVAAVFYNLLHLDIHIYTLAGITVSLGIIIDTSIIMVDHYSYYRDRRVFVSILGALLTTIGALGIVWLLPEEQRLNLVDFSLVIVINLAVSLFVALLFVPALLEKFPLGRSMTVSSVRRRRFTVRFSRLYGRFIAWGRRRRWIFVAALLWGFGLPTFLLPDRIEEEDGKPLPWPARWYNGVMGSGFVTAHRQTLDKVLGSSLNLFRTATGRYNYFRQPAQKVLYINAGMAEGCTVQQLDEVVRHMENYISRFDEVQMFRTNIYGYDNAQIIVTFKPEYENGPFPSMLKQELTAAAIRFGGATWRISGIDDNYFNNNVISNYRSNQIRLRGYNYDQLSDYADALVDRFGAPSQNRRVSQPETTTGNGWSLPDNELNIRYDDESRRRLGGAERRRLRPAGSARRSTARRSRRSTTATKMQRVVLESADRDRFDRWHVANAQVRIDSLQTKLSAVGTIERRRTGVSIYRCDQSYQITVGFDFIGSYELGRRLIERTVDRLDEETLPIGFIADSPDLPLRLRSEETGGVADPAGHRHHLRHVRRDLRVAAQTAGHHPDDPGVVHRRLPHLRLVGLRLRPGRIRRLRPAVRHRRQCGHLPHQRGGQLGRDVAQAGHPALPEGLQPQDRPHRADHPLDRAGARAVPLRRSRGGLLVRIRRGGHQRHALLAHRAGGLSADLPSDAPQTPSRAMMRKHHPLLRAAVLLLWTAACWRLFVPALDVPTQELRANALASMQGTLLLLLLAGTVLLVRAPRIRPNAADCCAALLLAGVTASRFFLPGPAAPARYDELLQAAMLYASLRILFTAERHAAAVLLTLLCLFGIYEAWTGIRQIYGFA